MKIEIPMQPRTKKNSQRIVKFGNRYAIMPSKLYKDYEKECAKYMPKLKEPISVPINVKCTYYMESRRKVDLSNLLECTCDVLTKYGVIEDDNRNIIASHDGSRVFYDKENPRAIIEIEPIKENYQQW